MPHLTLYDQLGDMSTLGRNSWVGRGSEPVGGRGPEPWTKVSPIITRGMSCGALCSKWILDPPLNGAWTPP